MKYRRLTSEELDNLEKEFINFLVVNGIEAKDWEKMKTTDSDRVNELLDTFSDMVMERVLAKVRFLEHREPKEIKVFHCEEDSIKLIGLRAAETSAVDFSRSFSPGQMLDLLKTGRNELRIYKAEKPYNKERETELFSMISAGCEIVDEKLYQTLESLYST